MAALFPTPSPRSPWRSCRICIWAARKTPRTWISWRSLASSTSWTWPLIFLTCSRTLGSSSTSRFPSPITGAKISHSFSQKPSALLVSKDKYCCYNLLFIQSQFWLNLPGPLSVLKPNGWHLFIVCIVTYPAVVQLWHKGLWWNGRRRGEAVIWSQQEGSKQHWKQFRTEQCFATQWGPFTGQCWHPVSLDRALPWLLDLHTHCRVTWQADGSFD